MTYKRAIAIGLLTSLGIGLLVFGIKTGTFKKQNIGKTTTPISYNINKKRNKTPLQVNADNDIMPVSLNWLWNEQITNSTGLSSNPFTYTTPEYATMYGTTTTFKNISAYRNPIGMSYLDKSTSSNTLAYQASGGGWYRKTYRVIKFSDTPTGSIITILNNNATPIYNNNVILTDGNCINQIRKSNIILTEEYKTNGSIINQDGQIKIYIDSGCTQLKINGVNYTSNPSGAINLTNNNIFIETTGTPTGQTANVFTINYFNTLPIIEPQPYPDASGKVTEVLDITGLMFQILTMPFTFISQAFNLTLWEGTPYQFNFSNFILSLISIATIIFIIKLFTSGFSVVGNYTSHRADTKLKKSQTKLNEAKTKKIESKTPKKE